MAQKLVLLHGWGLNSAVWDTLAPKLEPEFEVHAVNLPGFGGEPWHADDVEIEQVADKIAADLAHAQPHAEQEPVVLVGWSLGGLLATLIAVRHPQLVSRIHTVASSPCFVAHPESGWPGMNAAVLATFKAQLDNDFEATLKRFLAVQSMGSPHARQDVKALQASVLSQPLADPRALAAGLDWLAMTDLREALSQLSMPLHRAYGRLDSLVPVAVARHISHGESQIFEHSAHAPFLNQTDDFCRWLSDAH